MIEWAFGYPSISAEPWGVPHRDDATHPEIPNLACALDFTQPNFVLNAGFELHQGSTTSPPRWISDHVAQAIVEAAHPHSGRANAICTTNGSDCGLHQIVRAPLSGLHSYRLTLYAAASTLPASKLDGRVGADANGSVSLPVLADGTYHPYTMTITAAGGTAIRVWMYAGTQPGWVTIDDVRLAPL